MRVAEKGRTPEMQEERRTLTVRRSLIEKALASHVIDPEHIAETRRFGNRLQAEADRWLLRGGIADRGRIDKSTAHRMFALAFGRVSR